MHLGAGEDRIGDPNGEVVLGRRKRENKASCGRTQRQSEILISYETISGEETTRPNQVSVQGLLVKDYAFKVSHLHLAIEALR